MTNETCIGWPQGGTKFPRLRLKSQFQARWPTLGRHLAKSSPVPASASCPRSSTLAENFPQISAVGRLAQPRDVGLELGAIDPIPAIGDLLQAGDLEALAILDDMHELGGLEQRVVGAGVEPGGAAAEDLDLQLAGLEVDA